MTETQTEPTDDQRRMAQMMGLSPNHPESWPLAELNYLVWYEQEFSGMDFADEFERKWSRKFRRDR